MKKRILSQLRISIGIIIFTFLNYNYSSAMDLLSVKAITGHGALELVFSDELSNGFNVNEFTVKASNSIYPVTYGYINPNNKKSLILCLNKQMLTWPAWDKARLCTNPNLSYSGNSVKSSNGSLLSSVSSLPIIYDDIVGNQNLFVDPQPYFMGWENEMWWKTINYSTVFNEIHVDTRSPLASDTNSGAPGAPLKTLSKAINYAAPGTKIIVHPGIYREKIVILKNHSGNPNKPFILESLIKDSAIISGSDIWTDWSLTNGIYWKKWPYSFPEYTDQGTVPNALGRKQEMLFVNGVKYDQTLDSTKLSIGKYWVKNSRYICVKLPDGVKAEDVTIEVAIRDRSIEAGSEWVNANRPEYFVVKGFCFEKSLSGNVIIGNHTLVQNCTFSWNNQIGLATGGFDFAVRGVSCLHNGTSGLTTPASFQGYFSMNGLIESSEFSYNNWRAGTYGDQYGWFVGGIKVHNTLNSIYRGLKMQDNACPSLWMDIRCNNFLAEDCFFSGAKWMGFWTEISYGAVMLRNNTVIKSDGGMTLSSTGYEKIRGNIFYNNNYQIGSWEVVQSRDQDHKTIYTEIKHNVLSGKSLIDIAKWPCVYNTITVDSNFYNGTGWNATTFPNWRKLTFMQDANSVIEDPNFRKASENDFFPAPSSNLAYSKEWAFVNFVKITGNKLELIATQPNVEIRYTTDGSLPIKTSTLYTGPIDNVANILARAYKLDTLGENYIFSPIASSSFSVEKRDTFKFNVLGQDTLVTFKNSALPITSKNLILNEPGYVDLLNGNNYKVAGNKIVPDSGYIGYLNVPVKVKGYVGEMESDTFYLKVKVIDCEKIVFIDQDSVKSIKNVAFTISSAAIHTNIAGFNKIFPGKNYTLYGNIITPATGFIGELEIPVIAISLNAGVESSDTFKIMAKIEEKTTSVQQTEANNIAIFPNPAKESFTINTKDEIKNGTLNIYNNAGQIIKSELTDAQIITVDCKQFNNGFYLVEIIGQGKIFRSKIAVSK